MKFCRVFASRVRIALAEFRLIPEEESHASTAEDSDKNIILSWKSRTPTTKRDDHGAADHHKKQYLELSSDFASISFMPKSRTALENMKESIILLLLYFWTQ